jgi:DNA-binding Xre family transcriptional regulator
MIESRISEVATAKGFKSAYALQKALTISPTVAARLWRGDFKQIGIETLDRLCNLLRVKPDKLLFHTRNGDAE